LFHGKWPRAATWFFTNYVSIVSQKNDFFIALSFDHLVVVAVDVAEKSFPVHINLKEWRQTSQQFSAQQDDPS